MPQVPQTAQQIALQPVRVIPKWLLATLIILAFIGFGDASYLTAEHFAGVIPPCTIHGCETVLTSSYSVVLGVPLALIGALYYLALLISYFVYIQEKKAGWLSFTLYFSIVGFLADIWFVSAQAFIIHAWCQYCLLSATVSTLLFLISYGTLCKMKKTTIPSSLA
jgi:uncharacterized membrane protein